MSGVVERRHSPRMLGHADAIFIGRGAVPEPNAAHPRAASLLSVLVLARAVRIIMYGSAFSRQQRRTTVTVRHCACGNG